MTAVAIHHLTIREMEITAEVHARVVTSDYGVAGSPVFDEFEDPEINEITVDGEDIASDRWPYMFTKEELKQIADCDAELYVVDN